MLPFTGRIPWDRDLLNTGQQLDTPAFCVRYFAEVKLLNKLDRLLVFLISATKILFAFCSSEKYLSCCAVLLLQALGEQAPDRESKL